MTDEYPDPTDQDAPDEHPVGSVAYLGLGADVTAERGVWQGERTPPHDLLAEQSTLGGMMLSADVIDDVVEECSPSDFYVPKHEVIALAIVGLHRAGKPADVLSVTDELTKTRMLARAGGAEYLHTLTGIVPTAANAGHYARIVAEKATLRGLVEAGMRLQQMGYASEGNAADLVESARAQVDQVAARRRSPIVRIDEGLVTNQEYIDLVRELESPPKYLRTPWAALDELIGGFQPGGFYVIGGRPAGGKSIALLQCASRLAHEGLVAYSSLEMQRQELRDRLFAQIGGIRNDSLRDHKMTTAEFDALDYARSRIVGMPLYVDETRNANMTTIRGFVRSVSRHGRLGAALVDYLQLVDVPPGIDRQKAVGNVALDLKGMAKDHGIPVIAAAQLKRASFRGRVARPTMEDLRESGEIEQHADAIILLHRSAEDLRRGEVTLIVEKARNGQTGEFQLVWEGHRSRMENRGFNLGGLFGKDYA